jgi:hypothetical protein
MTKVIKLFGVSKSPDNQVKTEKSCQACLFAG